MRGSPQPDKRLLEAQFVFACVWAFGGTMLVDKVADYRALFSRWWTQEFKAISFPDKVGGLRFAPHSALVPRQDDHMRAAVPAV